MATCGGKGGGMIITSANGSKRPETLKRPPQTLGTGFFVLFQSPTLINYKV